MYFFFIVGDDYERFLRVVELYKIYSSNIEGRLRIDSSLFGGVGYGVRAWFVKFRGKLRRVVELLIVIVIY